MWNLKHTTLLTRLNVIDRGEDVIGIAEALLAALAAEKGKAASEFSPDARAILQSYPWPRNIRDFQSAVRQAVVMHNETVITAAMLPHRIQKAAGIAPMETEARDIEPAIDAEATMQYISHEAAYPEPAGPTSPEGSRPLAEIE